MKIKKKQTKEQRYKEALEKIADAYQLKENIRDYENIGKNAMYTAREALRNPCAKCGK